MVFGIYNNLNLPITFYVHRYVPTLHIREIGYLTDSKKVTITTIPRPME